MGNIPIVNLPLYLANKMHELIYNEKNYDTTAQIPIFYITKNMIKFQKSS